MGTKGFGPGLDYTRPSSGPNHYVWLLLEGSSVVLFHFISIECGLASGYLTLKREFFLIALYFLARTRSSRKANVRE